MTEARASSDHGTPEGLTPHERKLWRQRKARPVDESAIRPCLCCGEGFRSKWPGNRICKRCRETDVWSGSVATEYSVMR